MLMLSFCRQTMSLKGDQGLWCWSTVLILVIWLCFSIFIEFIYFVISNRLYQIVATYLIFILFSWHVMTRDRFTYCIVLMKEQAVCCKYWELKIISQCCINLQNMPNSMIWIVSLVFPCSYICTWYI